MNHSMLLPAADQSPRMYHVSTESFAKEPGKDCWVEASHHVWIGEREAATNAVP